MAIMIDYTVFYRIYDNTGERFFLMRIFTGPGVRFFLKIPRGKDPGNLQVHPFSALNVGSPLAMQNY
jgi:hypothetical protein